jgi:threonine/homoserine/homoserine lactone efflux protein
MTFGFLMALGAGVYVSLPTGPVGALIAERAIKSGFGSGIRVGIGSALAHLLFASLFVLGLSQFASFLGEQQNTIEIIGGIFLVCLGLRFILKKHLPHEAVVAKHRKAGEIAAGFLLTVLNPNQLVTYTLILSILGIPTTTLGRVGFGTGVFIGALLMSWLLAVCISKNRHHLKPKTRLFVFKLIGGVVLVVGLGMLWGGLGF